MNDGTKYCLEMMDRITGRMYRSDPRSKFHKRLRRLYLRYWLMAYLSNEMWEV
jgi:hypothetical protein